MPQTRRQSVQTAIERKVQQDKKEKRVLLEKKRERRREQTRKRIAKHWEKK